MINLEDVIVKPLLTEKSTSLMENGNRYSFQVHLKSNKNHIKKAIEEFFSVKVTSVKTCLLPGKSKRVGRFFVKKTPIKKAYVEIKDGQKIELFKGV